MSFDRLGVAVGALPLALLSALLLVLSFPKFDLGFLAWISLVPLLVALKGKGPMAAFSLSFLTGLGFYIGVCFWLNAVSGFQWDDFALLGLYLVSYVGLFGLAFSFLTQHSGLPSAFIAPVLWVSTEYLRSNAGFLGLPWALLGHSQYLYLPLIQISSITGVYGVSFLIVMVNGILSDALLLLMAGRQGSAAQYRSKLLKPVMVTVALLGISLTYGLSILRGQPKQDRIRVTVIQGNVPQDIRWKREFLKLNLEKHVTLTRESAENDHTSLIVWPETSVPGHLTQDLYLLRTISTLAKETNAHLLVGSAARPKFGPRDFRMKNRFNSAFLTSPRGTVVGQYNKIYLLPFAEYLPHKDILPWPSRFVSVAGNFIPGKEAKVFDVNGAKFGVTICWESIFPGAFRQFVENGANFMVNITNEAWFKETAAPYQFLAMNVFRAVENRVSIARSANTGISGFVDPYGRILGKVRDGDKDIFVEGYLTMEIPLSEGRTVYTVYGDIFAYLNLAIMSILLVSSVFKRSKGIG